MAMPFGTVLVRFVEVHVVLPTEPPSPYRRRMPIRIGLIVLAASQLLLALWMVGDPGGFFDQVGGFGTQNDHYIRDVATWNAALAVAAAIAVWQPSWRLPVLVFAAVQFTLHAINHIADAGDAVGSTDGAFDAVSLALGALLLGALAWLAARERTGVRAS
jgi:hypothetical protein